MKQIILSVKSIQKRAAWLENGQLQDFIVEQDDHQDIVGEIFKGRVKQVVPGMQAAFVDIGFNKYAYLERKELAAYKGSNEQKDITSYIHEGQELVVQVKKAAVGDKGAVVTELVEFPGKYLVYMPNGNYIAVSKKIENDKQRSRLKAVGESLCQNREGVIFRTECAVISDEQVRKEWEFLKDKAERTFLSSKNLTPPARIGKPQTIVERVLHEWSVSVFEEIITDSVEAKKSVSEHLALFNYNNVKVTAYQGREELFSAYHLDKVIEKSLKPYVWLKSGANITIEHTEALTVIDVNSAKYVGKVNKEKTISDVNKEAAVEIARQLRIRNIGGIILVDFINMKQEKHKHEVLEILKKQTANDRMTVHIGGYTRLGLVEMTRKKSRYSLSGLLTENCACCNGTGRILSDEAEAVELERELASLVSHDEDAALIEVAKQFAEYLDQAWRDQLKQVSRMELIFVESDSLTSKWNIRRLGNREELRNVVKTTNKR